jgi:Ulp1 family protease
MQRAKQFPMVLPDFHVFSTFFLQTLEQGYIRVKRWTKKIDLFSKSFIILPIHLGMHWTCACINFVKVINEMLKNRSDSSTMTHFMVEMTGCCRF